MGKKIKCSLIILFAFLILILLAFDTRLKVVNYTIESEKISGEVKLVVIADLHGCEYGERQSDILGKLEKINPDAVLLCGDIFDDEYNIGASYDLIDGISGKYESFYVSGNHEWWGVEPFGVFSRIEERKINVLRGCEKHLEINGNAVTISGVDDPEAYKYDEAYTGLEGQLETVGEDINEEELNILLSHRPEFADKYFEYDFDLVLSGHAHGGQVRIPFILNGLYSPGEGFFPKLAGGIYKFESGSLIVSRGLSGENTLLPRIFNRPELVVVTVKGKR